MRVCNNKTRAAGSVPVLRLSKPGLTPSLPRRPAKMAVGPWLEAIYAQYHRPEFRGSDPIDTLAPFQGPGDREIVGLIAALLAYGNVKAIQRGIADVLARMGCAGCHGSALRPVPLSAPCQWLFAQSPRAP